jgi:hypothetical protein
MELLNGVDKMRLKVNTEEKVLGTQNQQYLVTQGVSKFKISPFLCSNDNSG